MLRVQTLANPTVNLVLNGEIRRVDGFTSNPCRNQNFSPLNFQEIPQDEAFLQAQVNLQVICELGGDL